MRHLIWTEYASNKTHMYVEEIEETERRRVRGEREREPKNVKFKKR